MVATGSAAEAAKRGTTRATPKSLEYEKLSITLPRELALALREYVRAGGAPSVSAFLASLVREQFEHDVLDQILEEDFRENPITEEERAWARRVLSRRQP
ncbi:MAG: hypothetical protein HYY04_09540 [Chloroflexi bacterium]|nr:hypothetical protein [Chloroflexota bacterium]